MLELFPHSDYNKSSITKLTKLIYRIQIEEKINNIEKRINSAKSDEKQVRSTTIAEIIEIIKNLMANKDAETLPEEYKVQMEKS